MMKFVFLLITILSVLTAKPYNTIFIDGEISDWDETTELCISEPYDSVWNIGQGKNDIRKFYVTWDKYNLYIYFELELSNAGVIVYFSYDETSGSKDLTKLNTWRRLVQFSKPINLFFAAWEGQQGSFYHVQSSTYAYDVTYYFGNKFKKNIYELKLPFKMLFPYSETIVEKNAKISVVICIVSGDVATDSYGNYGYIVADTLPDNNITFMSTMTIDKFHVIEIDQDGDGIPDNKNVDSNKELVKLTPKVLPVYQKQAILEYTPPSNGRLTIQLVDINTVENIMTLYESYVNIDRTYKINIDLKTCADKVSSGLYILNLKLETAKEVKIKNVPVVLVK